jgi:hypothetical protein
MIYVNELNAYDPNHWAEYFFSNTRYKQISKHYQKTIFTYKEMTLLKAALHDTVYEQPRLFLKNYNILDAVPYYYINFLLEKTPGTIVDIGCGVNYFKPHFTNLIGIDADPKANFDIFDHFDKDFADNHQHSYDALISINTIHFASITAITEQLLLISKLIKPGGRGFVSFNFETWLMHTNQDQINILFGQYPAFDDIVNYTNEQILQTKLDFIVVDWPVLHITNNSTVRDDLNGNIRLVFNV